MADEATAIVDKILDRMDESWNRPDGHVPADVLDRDVEYVNIPGEHFHGAPSVVEETRRVKRDYGMAVVGREVLSARFLADGVILATVVVTYQRDAEHGGGKPVRGRQMFVLTDVEGEWRIAGYQNTLVQGPTATPE